MWELFTVVFFLWLTSFSAGEATVTIIWPWAMPSHDAAFLATEMDTAR